MSGVPTSDQRAAPAISWKEYVRLDPGTYSAYCQWAKYYRDPAFHRWTCLLRFVVLGEFDLTAFGPVPLWLNLGNDQRPHAGRRSRYFAEWVRANGSGPLRGDRLSPRVFVHRMARIEVADTAGNAPYSVVRKIVEWETGLGPGHSVSKSHSQGRHELNTTSLED